MSQSKIDTSVGHSIGPNEINHLHDEIMDHARISLAKAIEIGGALQAWKARLGHGNWMPWFMANIKFTLRTADRYRLLYARRDELKFDTVSNMSEAFRILSNNDRERRIPYHPICNCFPKMTGNDFNSLVQSIKELGLLIPITLYQGQILDGKLRYEACLIAGVEPKFQDLPPDKDPPIYAISANLIRSDWSEADRRTAIIKANELRQTYGQS
jgi:Protein of unknown function (DUF3102)